MKMDEVQKKSRSIAEIRLPGWEGVYELYYCLPRQSGAGLVSSTPDRGDLHGNEQRITSIKSRCVHVYSSIICLFISLLYLSVYL